MIDVKQALAKIKAKIPKPSMQVVPLKDALGSVLALDVRAPLALPVFDNSAMDGFVLRSKDLLKASQRNKIRLKIVGDICAGDTKERKIKSGEAYRIMTGALIPAGGDTILIKENALVDAGYLVLDAPVQANQHIRRKGEELKRGERVLRKGTLIHPGTMGFMATLGLNRVKVFARPRVSVIATGSELVVPGKALKRGQIYESNSWMVRAALQDMNITPVEVKTVKDNLKTLRQTLKHVLQKSDVVILMGGVSVGEYDYVKTVLEELKVRKIFWRVKQKPGKPVYFGKLKQTLIFGLPGNPASVFTCFYKYVYPALRCMSGFPVAELENQAVTAEQDIGSDAKRTLLLKGKVYTVSGQRRVSALRHQGSHMLSSLCETNAFVVLPPKSRSIRRGDKVQVDLLPFGRTD